MAADSREVHINWTPLTRSRLGRDRITPRGAPTVGSFSAIAIVPNESSPPFYQSREIISEHPRRVKQIADGELRRWLEAEGWPDYAAQGTLELGFRPQRKERPRS